MKDNILFKDVFKCSNCNYEMDENYIGCPECKQFGTISFEKSVAIGPCQCADCVALEKRKEKHLNHPFYIDARKIWVNHQQEQIKKGSVKYPEPFTPSSWSNEELVEHAIQENVDQLHYIVGMKERMEHQEKEIEKLKADRDYWKKCYKEIEKDYDSIESENRTLKGEF